jgi:hypothetical protein
MEPIGYAWLIERFALPVPPLSHQSFVGTRSRMGVTGAGDTIVEWFQPSYHPGDTPLAHLAFALKYDDLNLNLLASLFAQLPQQDVIDFIRAQPNGKYARQIGFLYEFVTGTDLPLPAASGGNYVDLLDPTRFIVAATQKNPRWRMNNNLLGNPRYCPIVRKIAAMEPFWHEDYAQQLQAVQTEVTPALFQRALDYLYFKETRSSYDIERDQAPMERQERFVLALRNAGRSSHAATLQPDNLTALQNLIVEPRYTQSGFRTWQNYVGEVLPNRMPKVHYICPPGEMVADLMSGLAGCAERMQGVPPLIRAAVISFGFVFIHPFEDGNGRLHRYLIHDSLARDGVVPSGMIIPISATMLRHMQPYDAVLEAYSRPLKALARYQLDENEILTVNNPAQVAGYYRFPDLTAQALYTMQVVKQTIADELWSEIHFVRNYDLAREAIKMVVDMPDRQLDRLIKFLHQNHGTLSKAKRHFFAELTDDELRQIAAAYQTAFGMSGSDGGRVGQVDAD